MLGLRKDKDMQTKKWEDGSDLSLKRELQDWVEDINKGLEAAVRGNSKHLDRVKIVYFLIFISAFLSLLVICLHLCLSPPFHSFPVLRLYSWVVTFYVCLFLFTFSVHFLIRVTSSVTTRSTHFRQGSFSFMTCFFTMASNAKSGVNRPVLWRGVRVAEV